MEVSRARQLPGDPFTLPRRVLCQAEAGLSAAGGGGGGSSLGGASLRCLSAGASLRRWEGCRE